MAAPLCNSVQQTAFWSGEPSLASIMSSGVPLGTKIIVKRALFYAFAGTLLPERMLEMPQVQPRPW